MGNKQAGRQKSGKSVFLIKVRGGFLSEYYPQASAFIMTAGIERAKAFDTLKEAAAICERIAAPAVIEVAEDNRREWKSVHKRSRNSRKRDAEE